MKKQTLLVAFSLIPTRLPIIFPEDCENPVKQIQLLSAIEQNLTETDNPSWLVSLDNYTLPAPIPLIAAMHMDFDAYTYDVDKDIFVETTFVKEAKYRDNG